MAERTWTTPAGDTIVFEDGLANDEGKSKRRTYTVNGQVVPSVTTVLGILDKPALMYTSERLAVAGAVELAAKGELPDTVDGALSRLKARELRFYQQWGKKAETGTIAHEDLLALATGQPLANLDTFSLEARGHIRGVSDWFADARPKTLDAETPVVSRTYGYAGRYDLRAEIAGEVCLIDLKTTSRLPRYKDGQVKPPYDEHVLQLEAYDQAAFESGYESSDRRLVLRVDATGAYDVTESWAHWSDFVAILMAYKHLKAMPRPKYKKLPKAEAA